MTKIKRSSSVPLVNLSVRDPSVGDVNPLQVASPLWASKMVGRCRSAVMEEPIRTDDGDREDDGA